MEIGRRVIARSVGLFRVLGVLLFLAQAQTTHAAIITVNTIDDELNSDGDCSLREVIQAANTDSAVDACTAGSGTDVLTLPVGTYTLTLNFALVISTDLTLSGAGANTTIIQAAASPDVANFRVFLIFPDATVTISGVTIRHGNVVGTSGGGISNLGTLTVANSTIRDNTAFNAAGISNGSISSTLTLVNSTIRDNTAIAAAGGIFNFGGTVVLTNSALSNNIAGERVGGIFNSFAGTTMITNSTISGNVAITGGGIGIFNGEVILTNSTVSGNVSTLFGGGGIRLSQNGTAPQWAAQGKNGVPG